MKAMQTQFSSDNQAFLLKNVSLSTSSTPVQTSGQSGQIPNTGYTHGSTPKQSFSQSNYPRKSHRKEKVMLKIPYGVISASDIDIPETHVGRYMGVLQ